ncbi:hypothetical protein Y032_0317g2302 [Ancylostoma ceylanicum]|uniref:Uncharacterized protein n=1 Tax=Ancylostoma ceylanicum TaxID=53326 RepID=A0A016S281_9BILA|nr:hypothetical protein Y032_0317g2302 [Ancylostoma ceylanicum]
MYLLVLHIGIGISETPHYDGEAHANHDVQAKKQMRRRRGYGGAYVPCRMQVLLAKRPSGAACAVYCSSTC